MNEPKVPLYKVAILLILLPVITVLLMIGMEPRANKILDWILEVER